jgi:hypothetical protein
MTNHTIHLEISLPLQKLYLKQGDEVIKEYPVSTAKNGAGEQQDSECTPRGKHSIAEMLGDGCVPDTVFVERETTGEIYNLVLRKQFPGRDWILTRILRLKGEEPGVNQGGVVDTYERCIYIHGSPGDTDMRIPGSHGCIRMRNADVIELYDKVAVGTQVLICA